jgi:hypothetical protein
MRATDNLSYNLRSERTEEIRNTNDAIHSAISTSALFNHIYDLPNSKF